MSTTIAWVRNPPDNTTQGETWNVTTGCSRVSAGCKGCYAERLAGTRLSRLPAYVGLARPTPDGPRWTGEVRFDATKLAVPLRRRKPTGYFVNDMSDLFHERVTDEQIAAVFGICAATPRHRYFLCTKRAARMERWFAARWPPPGSLTPDPVGHCITVAARTLPGDPGIPVPGDLNQWPRWPLPNVWLLVSVEDQATADERIPHLLRCPAAVRGLSMEPLLGLVGIQPYLYGACDGTDNWLDWVIVGGESGPKARPCDIEWIRSLVAQCAAAGVPVFVKQLGHWAYDSAHASEEGTVANIAWDDPAGGDPSEWPPDLQVREWPEVKP